MLVEVWGRQMDVVDSDNSGLTTEELMKKDKTLISGGEKVSMCGYMAPFSRGFKRIGHLLYVISLS